MSTKYRGEFDLQKSKKLAKIYLIYLIFLTINSILFIFVFNDRMMTGIFGLNLFIQVIFVFCCISSAQSGDIFTWGRASRGPKKAGEALIFSGFLGIFIFLIYYGFINRANVVLQSIVGLYMIMLHVFQIYLGLIYFKIDRRETR